MPSPKAIRSHRELRQLELEWPDGIHHFFPFKFLRGECPCAACVDEFTGRRILDITTIPETIAPTAISFTGNYALKIEWNDGHSTGLYTWDALARLGNDPQVGTSRDEI